MDGMDGFVYRAEYDWQGVHFYNSRGKKRIIRLPGVRGDTGVPSAWFQHLGVVLNDYYDCSSRSFRARHFGELKRIALDGGANVLAEYGDISILLKADDFLLKKLGKSKAVRP